MRPEFPDYDAAVAAGLLRAGEGDGLTGWLGARVVDVGPGRLTCELPVRDDLLTPFGTLHGGVVAALVDHVLGLVCYPVIPRGSWAATTEFKVNFVAPVREGTLRATAEIASKTARTAVVQIEVVNGVRLAALAQGTVTIQAPRS